MKIDGRKIARQMQKDLALEVRKLKKQKKLPHLVVILIGSDPSSLSYVKQKVKTAKLVRLKVTVHHFKKIPLYQKLAVFIKELNADPTVHGIIIQRPLPPSLSAESLTKIISPLKDVDGFLTKSMHLPPLGLAIIKILKYTYYTKIKKPQPKLEMPKPFVAWLRNQNIVLIGRGETGGKPIGQMLSKYNFNYIMLNSSTENGDEYIRQADIIISAVGRARMVTSKTIKPGAIIIGIGLHKEKDQLVGDFEEKDIAKVAEFYTPTPGGAGPVNVTCLLQNAIEACKMQKK